MSRLSSVLLGATLLAGCAKDRPDYSGDRYDLVPANDTAVVPDDTGSVNTGTGTGSQDTGGEDTEIPDAPSFYATLTQEECYRVLNDPSLPVESHMWVNLDEGSAFITDGRTLHVAHDVHAPCGRNFGVCVDFGQDERDPILSLNEYDGDRLETSVDFGTTLPGNAPFGIKVIVMTVDFFGRPHSLVPNEHGNLASDCEYYNGRVECD